MAVRGENSFFFGENAGNYEFPNLKSMYNASIPKYEPMDFPIANIVSNEELSQKQINKQQELLDFLEEVNSKQSATSRKQFIVIMWLTIVTIMIGIITVYLTYVGNLSSIASDAAEQETLLQRKNIEQQETILELRKEIEGLGKQVEALRAEGGANKSDQKSLE